MLVVADLHLEKGSAYAARGQMLPPYDTARDPGAAWRPRSTALGAPPSWSCLGDTFHDRQVRGPAGAPTTPAPARPGPARTADLGGRQPRRRRSRGPARRRRPDEICGRRPRPAPRAAPTPQAGEAAGHLHPCAQVAGPRRAACAAAASSPTASAHGRAGLRPTPAGLNIRDAAFAGLLRRALSLGAAGRGPRARRRLELGGRGLIPYMLSSPARAPAPARCKPPAS